jgi:hypothetical protein
VARGWAQAAAALLVLAIGSATTGCSLLPGNDDAPSADVSSASVAAAPQDVVAGIQSALDGRAAAVVHDDARAFRAGLARGDRALRREQSTYFDNLTQLPLGAFRYSFDPADLVREGEDYWVVVDLRMQLEGYDDRPVVSRDRYRFSPDGTGFRLASVSDLQWEAEHQVQQQPWESGPITVRAVPGVLGIFDEDSERAADGLLKSVQQGIVFVSAVVPYEWARSVVVYALSDTAFLDSIPDLPGSDPETLDGVAFPVPAGPDTNRPAATRIVLHPRMLDRDGPARDRLVRHELTHVAVGTHDDLAPVWLSEGLAEYTSVRPMAPEERDISEGAVRAARDGFTDLPTDERFNDQESPVHYAEAWWACEYLASSLDETTLWSLLDQLGKPDADRTGILVSYTGLNTRQLARKAGKLLLATYDPSALDHPPKEPSPTPSPTDGATDNSDQSLSPSPEPTPSPSA